MAVLKDESKMAKDFRRQPDWALQKLGIQRDTIQTPRSGGIENSEGGRPTIPKYSPPHMRRIEKPFITFDNPLLNGSKRWRDVHRDQREERNRKNQDNGGRNGNEENDGNWNNTNRGNIINNNKGSNRYGSNQNNGNNDDNYGNGNGGGRNNNNCNGGNHGNNNNNNGGGNN